MSDMRAAAAGWAPRPSFSEARSWSCEWTLP
jgi:hypothetical protein